MTEIMEGVRILDFTQEIQGPWGTAILADMGAEVIKIERRETGDLSRSAITQDPEELGVSPYFTVHNRKRASPWTSSSPTPSASCTRSRRPAMWSSTTGASGCSSVSASATPSSRRSSRTSSSSRRRPLVLRVRGPASPVGMYSAKQPAGSWMSPGTKARFRCRWAPPWPITRRVWSRRSPSWPHFATATRRVTVKKSTYRSTAPRSRCRPGRSRTTRSLASPSAAPGADIR